MKIQQRRRLTDLYARGEFVELSDESPAPPLVLWIRKLTPTEAETAYLKASARRASLVAGAKGDPPSDLWLALSGEIDSFNRDDLISWVVGTEMVDRRPIVEAKLADEAEWKDDGYLESLRARLFEEDFVAKQEEDAQDPEVVRVSEELARFYEALEVKVAEERTQIERDHEHDADEDLREKVMTDMIRGQGDSVWLAEFQHCQVWLCTYDSENRNERYFATRAEVDQLQGETYKQILAAIERVHVGDVEGKGSQPVPASSPPSDTPETQVMDVSSSLVT